MLRVNADTRRLAWDVKLRDEVLMDDPFEALSMVVSTDEKKTIPEAAVIKVSADSGAFSKTITTLKALSGNGVEGRTQQLGAEEEQSTRSLTVYANNFSNAVNVERYGIDAKEMDAYGIREKSKPQLARWGKETMGRYKREAVCERYSSNLVVAPTSLTQGINANVFYAGVADPVVYDSTAATYVTAIDAAAPATPGATNRLSQSVLDDLIETIQLQRNIEGIEIGGSTKWILMVPTRQKKFILSPGTSNFYETFRDGDVRGPNNKVLKHVIGSYGPILMIEDPRSPIVTVNTTVTFAYKGAGDTENRTLSADNNRFDVAMLLGKGALYEYSMEEVHFEDEIQGYKKNQGIGMFCTKGWRVGEFDLPSGSQTDTSILAKSSALLFCGTN
tara:strand:+ start:8034 stop:9200 length:1167 start_codon:yes stop_codon:yes gene_type:complete